MDALLQKLRTTVLIEHTRKQSRLFNVLVWSVKTDNSNTEMGLN